MERKLLIIIIFLAASLIVGGSALAIKNKEFLLGKAQISQQWIEIKSRTDNQQKDDGQQAALFQKSASGKQSKTTQTDPQKKIAAAKTAPTQIQWCDNTDIRAQKPSVIINEAAWMGTDKSYADEWIELKNLFRETVDIVGWQLQNKNKSIKISFKEGSIIPSGGFYLLERTDDSTVQEISASALYTGNLANSNEAIYLYDNFCLLQDSVIASPDWPAGDNASKQTMERSASLLWQTSKDSGGTPKSENSSY